MQVAYCPVCKRNRVFVLFRGETARQSNGIFKCPSCGHMYQLSEEEIVAFDEQGAAIREEIEAGIKAEQKRLKERGE